MKPYVVAIDIGTTSTKVAIVDREGKIQVVTSEEYPLSTPMPGRAEQDPELIMRAVLEGTRKAMSLSGVSPDEVRCISFSAAMHSLIALDHEDQPLTACITWADNRSASYVNILKEQYNGHDIYAATGTPIHPMSPLLKIMWLRDNAPEIYQATSCFVGIKEFILNRWFGVHIMDESMASATGLYSLRERKWYAPALAAAGITEAVLPKLVPTTHILRGMAPEWAGQLGVAADTPIVVGATDGVLANLGVGAIDPNSYAVTIGTSGAVRAVVREPHTDAQGRTFCYVLTEDSWVVGGAINNGGVLFRWVRDELATKETEEARADGIDPYERLCQLAAEAPAGSGGLVVLPLFAGERAPYWNADVRGVFFGLSLAHGKKHMIRAVLEGIGYAIRSVAEAVEDAAGKPLDIRASGGFARSPFWRQIIADIVGAPLLVPDAIEGSALGAAALGLYAMGDIASLEETKKWIQIVHLHEPNQDYLESYDELFHVYKDLYPRLVEPFAAITSIQNKGWRGTT